MKQQDFGFRFRVVPQGTHVPLRTGDVIFWAGVTLVQEDGRVFHSGDVREWALVGELAGTEGTYEFPIVGYMGRPWGSEAYHFTRTT